MESILKTAKDKVQFNKWLTTLYSGKYKQDLCQLQDEDGYCCLGVACKVLIPKTQQAVFETGLLKGGLPEEQEFAPKWLKEIEEDFGLKTGRTLSYLNDSSGLKFEEIATLLQLVYIHKMLD